MYKMDLSNSGQKQLIKSMINAVMVLYGLIDLTVGHGRLWEPPSRSTMWRRGYNTTVNINDNELSCGGFTNQWISYRGLCGVCGDPYQQKPRDNEIGGKYASGIITRTYPIGGKIEVIIGLTANHMGYFEFKLCPILDQAIGETQACMDSHQLKILNGDLILYGKCGNGASTVQSMTVVSYRRLSSPPDPSLPGSTEDNGYRFHIRDSNIEGNIQLVLVLPRNFLCKHCVLQWRYRTGTRWGCEPDLSCGKGKGPQEEFYGCSDISIGDVSSTIYNDPVIQIDPDKGVEGLNDLGAHKAHNVIWSIEPKPHANYLIPKPNQYAKFEPKVIKEAKTAYPFSSLHNKHMATLRVFLEELTLRALLRYYGTKRNHQHANCSPTKRYQKNPIVHEFCERICSYDIGVCPDLLCFCTPDPNALKDKAFTKAPNYFKTTLKDHSLDKTHLKKFVRKLITKNKLVENVPTIELKAPPSSSDVFRGSNTRSIKMTRLGTMGTIPSGSRFRTTKQALQEETFLPTKYTTRSKMADVVPDINNFVTKSSLNFASTFYTDKHVNFGSHTHAPSAVKPKTVICTASVKYSHNPFMAKWCNTNCPFGFCPSRVCSCD